MTEHTAHVTLNAERASSSARPQRNRLVLRAIARQPTRWLPSEAKVALNVVMDAAIIEAPPPENARISYSHVVGVLLRLLICSNTNEKSSACSPSHSALAASVMYLPPYTSLRTAPDEVGSLPGERVCLMNPLPPQ